MGGVNQPLGAPSLPFSSPLPFPLPPFPLSPSFPPECCAKVAGGGGNPPEGVWETPCVKLSRYKRALRRSHIFVTQRIM